MTAETAHSASRSDTSVLKFASIDDYLGPSHGRFFGSGYRRSIYTIRPGGGDADLNSVVDVSYPSDWSQKHPDTDLRPHLSTVDVMVLSVRSAEALLIGVLGLGQLDVDAAQIQRLTVRAGTRPEESLMGLPLTAQLKKTVPAPGGQVDSTVTTTVGVMKSTVVLRHTTPVVVGSGEIDYAHLGEDSQRHWGAGYRHDEQALTDVVADSEALYAQSALDIQHHRGEGTQASHAPGEVSYIDAFVSMLQLGQVLMYELDQIERSQSETLWMQSLTLRPGTSTTDRTTEMNHPADATVRIADHQLLSLPTGKWRNLDFRGDTGGINMTASFAHRIPDLEGPTS